MAEFDRLAAMPRHEVARWILAGGADGVTGQESLAVLYLFGRRLTDAPGEIPADEWPELSRAYDKALGLTPYDGFEALAQRLNLMAVLLRSVAPRTDVALLDPDDAGRRFIDALPMSRPEAERLAADWARRDVAEIRQLRRIKNLLTPLTMFGHLIGDPELSARVAEWARLRDRLP